MAMHILAADFGNYGPDLLNDVANHYINAINQGFGLIQGDVAFVLGVLPLLLGFVNDLFSEIEKAPGRRDAFRYDEADRFPETERDRGDSADRLGLAVAGDQAACAAATAAEISRLVGATHVVAGGFELTGSTLTVRSRAIHLDTGRMLPEIVERGPLQQMFEVYARIARRLVPTSTVAFEQMERSHAPLAAFELYIKGVLAEAPATKLEYLDDALELYPNVQRARVAQVLGR